jgi:hypothetical protein
VLGLVSSPTEFHLCSSPSGISVPTYASDFAPRTIGTRFLAVGDEAGVVRVLDVEKEESPGIVSSLVLDLIR